MHEHEHEGSFAEGQERSEHHPEREPHGDFASEEDRPEHRHEGSFAEGQETQEHHPEGGPHGDFAEGQEEED
jgi:hypothetical protein